MVGYVNRTNRGPECSESVAFSLGRGASTAKLQPFCHLRTTERAEGLQGVRHSVGDRRISPGPRSLRYAGRNHREEHASWLRRSVWGLLAPTFARTGLPC